MAPLTELHDRNASQRGDRHAVPRLDSGAAPTDAMQCNIHL